MLEVLETGLTGVYQVTPPTIFNDFRGTYIETYNKNLYGTLEQAVNHKLDFIQDDISVSHKNVLRGVHGDQETWKLISCLQGSFYLVVVNNDSKSIEFRKWQSFYLSDSNNLQILVPPKFGNGHLVISEQAIFHYKQTTEYDRGGQFTIYWNDPDYSIQWPISNPVLSPRDSGLNP
jgi:dTDP-4-dehydrorhamnose 3,5-epimerase